MIDINSHKERKADGVYSGKLLTNVSDEAAAIIFRVEVNRFHRNDFAYQTTCIQKIRFSQLSSTP
jgi:hypothetical protein